MTVTIWAGARSKSLNFIEAALAKELARAPTVGRVTDPKLQVLEAFRLWQQLYYRRHNDGDRPNYGRTGKLARITGVFYNGESLTDGIDQLLEDIGNALISAAFTTLQLKGRMV